jgi:hypothetical protein
MGCLILSPSYNLSHRLNSNDQKSNNSGGGNDLPQYVGSKWRKTKAILRSKSLQQIVPRTVRFNWRALKMMLQQYSMVYIKPDTGSHGNGVIRVEKSQGQYRFQVGQRIRAFESYSAMFNAVNKETRGRKYLVQRGIHLLKYNGRRFDLRVMAQFNPRRNWETTGIIGRVAAPRKIVTNYHNGGKLLSVNQLLSSQLSKSAFTRKLRMLEHLGVTAGKVIHQAFPGVREVGVDVGMDHTLTPWILEVNTRPDPYIFRKLPNPAVFRKIKRYAKAYGRL